MWTYHDYTGAVNLMRKKLGREWVSQDSCVAGRLWIEGDSVNSNL